MAGFWQGVNKGLDFVGDVIDAPVRWTGRGVQMGGEGIQSLGTPGGYVDNTGRVIAGIGGSIYDNASGITTGAGLGYLASKFLMPYPTQVVEVNGEVLPVPEGYVKREWWMP